MSATDLATLQAMPACEAVDLLLPDMNGLLRGKRIDRSALEKIYRDGVCLPMSLIGTDITGNTVEETGLGYDIGDEDRICRPLPGSLRPVPWSPRPMAQLLLTMEDGAGGLFAANPREVLGAVLARYAQRGLTPVVAVELEFYLFDQRCDQHGRPRSSLNPVTGARNTSTQVYYIEDLNDYRGFTDAVAGACQAQSIPADTAVAEYAPGQFEINLKHRDDALRACDDAVYLKRAIKAVAQQQGVQASFMAKPLVDQAGSGMHIHVSVLDGDGNNVFASPVNQPTAALRHAIGGLQHNAKDCLLLFAPHANSYRRFVLNAFVPLNDCWGYNNRTVALRIPHSDPANTRIEHRIAGADANIYLVTAAVLAGMLDGIERQREPGPPVVGNAYEQTDIHTPYWRQAIDDFLASNWINEQFGASFQHVFGQQKLAEMRRFESHVSDLEYDWYLRSV
ncbi:gamma-glutamylputrescine synthetase [Pseudoxanthomonas dokdonensis]|uniref:Gamma-glutamylputrescine synthetase n=2 Tax=Pseudoxanthomonas dokdonensis TaxID=344882 RepID=A0A0R0CVT2_9GAMM|nr:glutamine synthetase family protein [Pseudoxanthomonas dokdonensis]KRG69796.1 gamma-glutamylputrescine synthetase [Pseudoxanthomonas dokdonensis]